MFTKDYHVPTGAQDIEGNAMVGKESRSVDMEEIEFNSPFQS